MFEYFKPKVKSLDQLTEEQIDTTERELFQLLLEQEAGEGRIQVLQKRLIRLKGGDNVQQIKARSSAK